MANKYLRADGDYTLNPRYPLKPLQNEAVDYLLRRRFAVLVHQTGLGKTYTVLTVAQHLLNGRPDANVVVICPSSANTAFRTELEEKLQVPYTFSTAAGVNRKGKNPRFHVYNYSSVKQYEGRIAELASRGPLVLILDEVHNIQNQDSARHVVTMRIRRMATVCYGLTATPLMTLKNVKGLYTVIEAVKPGLLGPWASFKRQFVAVTRRQVQVKGRKVMVEEVVGLKNRDALRELMAPWVLARAIDYNLEWHYHKVPMTTAEELYYRRAGKGILMDADPEHPRTFSSRLHDLQRIVNNSHESLPDDLRGRLSSKEKLFLRVLRDEVLASHKGAAVVYCEHLATIARLKRVLQRVMELGKLDITQVLVMSGQVSQAERERAERVAGPGTVILISKVGGQSWNLKACNHVVLYDTPFAIGQLVQIIGRVTRVDTEHEVLHAHVIEADDTIDTYKRKLIQDNSGIISGLFGSNPSLPDMKKLDRRNIVNLRRRLLWRFKGNVARSVAEKGNE